MGENVGARRRVPPRAPSVAGARGADKIEGNQRILKRFVMDFTLSGLGKS
jgi:hypothetical protein